MNRRAVYICLAVLVVAASAFGASRGVRWFDPVTERWTDVEPEALLRRIPASGELRSANAVSLGCPSVYRMWNFTISMMADEGTEVREGQPVLGFDNQQFRDRVDEAQNRLDQALSTLEKTRLEQQNAVEALELELAEARAEAVKLQQKLAVPEDLEARLEMEKLKLDGELADEVVRLLQLQLEAQRETMVSRIASAENEVAKRQRILDQTQRDMQRFQILSPRAGYVVHLKNFEGEKLKVGETTWIGQSVLEIADLSEMDVFAEVAESDARYVAKGQRVEVRLDAAPDRVFPGEIVELGSLFHEKSPEVPRMVFDATIRLDEPDAAIMRPGMAVKVEILSPTEQPVMHVPENAIVQTARGPALQVRRDGTTRQVPVELGARWNGRVIVESGLQAGDRVEVTGHAG